MSDYKAMYEKGYAEFVAYKDETDSLCEQYLARLSAMRERAAAAEVERDNNLSAYLAARVAATDDYNALTARLAESQAAAGAYRSVLEKIACTVPDDDSDETTRAKLLECTGDAYDALAPSAGRALLAERDGMRDALERIGCINLVTRNNMDCLAFNLPRDSWCEVCAALVPAPAPTVDAGTAAAKRIALPTDAHCVAGYVHKPGRLCVKCGVTPPPTVEPKDGRDE